MTKKLVLLFVVVALSAAVAKNYPVTLYSTLRQWPVLT